MTFSNLILKLVLSVSNIFLTNSYTKVENKRYCVRPQRGKKCKCDGCAAVQRGEAVAWARLFPAKGVSQVFQVEPGIPCSCLSVARDTAEIPHSKEQTELPLKETSPQFSESALKAFLRGALLEGSLVKARAVILTGHWEQGGGLDTSVDFG